PELMGAHIGPERSHTTGRRHDLSFRGITALFGHLGIEWNLLSLSEDELEAVASIIALHRRFRPLLHGGDTVRFETEDAYVAHGVYDAERAEALVGFAVVHTAPHLLPPPLRLPGLDAARRYRVEPVPLPGERRGPNRSALDWIETGIELTGRQLEVHGIQLPALHPESAILLHLTAID
ncbi:MAG: GH36 C-terminal domain-containing protein, partial [Ilumatobacteraceae bacterium]